MEPLSSKDFPQFFQALYGFEPLPWQQNLLELVADSDDSASWPEAIALPTSSGKTAILAIAVFALACQAHRPLHQRSAPRRIFFVVDRRIIVDEAFERARHMAQLLRKDSTVMPQIIQNVSSRLMSLAGGKEFAENPLEVFQLRGGIYRDDAWAKTPLQPSIITSTVDQIGSRLLFRGYGVSKYSNPIHAGLTVNDSLIILDEAHCSNPFYQTVASIKRYRSWAEKPISTPFAFVVMSATPPPGIKSQKFELGDEDRKHPILEKRLNAEKPAKLMDAKKAKNLEELAEIVAQTATEFSTTCKATAVIVNRVGTAIAIHGRLKERPEIETILLTGRMRPFDRDQVVNKWKPFLRTGSRNRNQLSKPLVVVATQCLEVGADFDFDGLITECAAFDALCQRFGRLNRDGRDINAKAIIFLSPSFKKLKENDTGTKNNTECEELVDPVYGPALIKTWKFLNSHQQGKGKNKFIGLGISEIKNLQDRYSQELLECQAPSPDAPILFPSHLDILVQTDPRPAPDPDISAFLHGVGRGQADVQVCWRADISISYQDQQQWVDTVSICPPSSAECLTVPLYVLMTWLNEPDPNMLNFSDVVGVSRTAYTDATVISKRQVLCWGGPEESTVIGRVSHIRAGDTIVIPEKFKGWDLLGYIPKPPDGKSAVDIGDEANFKARNRPVLRLFPDLIRNWYESEYCELLAQAMEAIGEIPEDLNTIMGMLRTIEADGNAPEWLRMVIKGLCSDKSMEVRLHPLRGLILRSKKRIDYNSDLNETFTSDDDSSLRTIAVKLEDHSANVCACAKVFAEGCGLDTHTVNDIVLSGGHHDFGKADPRFQVMLLGGNRYAFGPSSPILAKSGSVLEGKQARRLAGLKSGYPVGKRHETLSVRFTEASPSFHHSNDPELVLYLIGTHHGRCRPFAPEENDPEELTIELDVDGQTVQISNITGLDRLDSGVAERFWTMVRRYGWWGAAFMEVILRLSDHRSSEWEQKTVD